MSEITTFTADEVLAALADAYRADPDGEGISWDEMTIYVPGADDPFPNVSITLDGQPYTPKIVFEKGGMDEGSDRRVVISVGSQFFEKCGCYASHYGCDWDGSFTEVKPAEKTVTVYEATGEPAAEFYDEDDN